MELYGYIAFIFMGLSLGLLGGGGSILTIPILVYLFKMDPIQATSYSLLIVGSTALVGGINFLRNGQVDLKTGFIFAVPSFVGVYVTRAFVMPYLPDPILSFGSVVISKAVLIMAAFAILMLVASIKMIRPRKVSANSKELSSAEKTFQLSMQGLFVGAITGFVGAGGGFLIIPALVVLVGMPMKLAVGTSLFIIAANSSIGVLGDLQRQTSINWLLVVTLLGIAIVGLFIGTVFSKRVSEGTLKKGFGYFVLLMGAMILFDQIHKNWPR